MNKEYCISKNYFWTDSAVVDCWAKNRQKEYKPYAQRRLQRIRDVITEDANWMSVPSKLNPADLPTRGVTPHSLAKSNMWFHGPDFLGSELVNLQHKEAFRKNTDTDIDLSSEDNRSNIRIPDGDLSSICLLKVKDVKVHDVSDDELMKTSNIFINNGKEVNTEYRISEVMDIDRYGSLIKLLRVTAWVIRFKDRLRRKCDARQEVLSNNVFKTILSTTEILAAKHLWIADVQIEMRQSPKFNSLQYQLDFFEDENGLIRCGSRLKHADMNFNNKYPHLLLKDHLFTKLVVLHAHKLVKHSNLRETINQLRTEYWIPKSRPYVKRILSACTLCRTFQSKSYNYPRDSQLPVERLMFVNAFNCVGIDYACPLYVKAIFEKDSKMHKVWVGLITCASSRAVFLDLVPDCSASSCVNLLTRFFNTRGAPHVVISDNGAGFVSREVEDYITSLGITWKFNVALAPWMGGFFESLVGSFKRVLRKVIRKVRLNYVEMLTIVKEVENVLNNRP